MGLWTSAKNHYRRSVPERYAYVKIAGGNPRTAIEHIRKVTDELIPDYPADIHFFDTALEELYSKSGRQGALITALCLMAVFLSLVGVFGLVIFELQGREKEIAVRRSTWVHGPADPLDAELVFPPDHARLFYYLDPACLLRGECLATKLRL